MTEKIEIIDDYLSSGQNIHTRIKPGDWSLSHGHEFVEVFYVLSGSCDHQLNSKISHLNIGDAYILLPGDIHCYITDSKSKDFLYRDILVRLSYFKSICDSYESTLYDDFINRSIDTNIIFDANKLFLLENLFLKLSDTSGSALSLLSNLVMHNLLTSFVNKKVMSKTSQYPSWLITLVSILSQPQNFATPLKELTSIFHYAQPYMCKAFKKHIGVTMTDYFNKNRISHARSLLNATNNTVEQVCERLGFDNISYFYELYKKYFNETPRKSIAKD